MLRKFRVSNFKSFDKDFELDLTKTNGYGFNKESIKNGTVNQAIIYGENGVGKSNLAFAIFDIIEHLTDNERNENLYRNYLNANSDNKLAHFYFEFFINSKIVVYEYKKSDYKTIFFERFLIEGEELISFNREFDTKATVLLKGTETLNTEIANYELSVLKYIKNNSNLVSNEENKTFLSFFTFIETMLHFRSLTNNMYQGTDVEGSVNIIENIIEKGNVNEFEEFLNEAGIECKLGITSERGRNTISMNFGDKQLPFSQLASTGTLALTLFYFWFQTIKEQQKVSFLFIDEFDAFYHHALSTLIVEKLKETGVQFILTTHNTSIMTNDLLRPDCYFTMTKQQIRSFSNSTTKELREAHNIEKMYKAGTFNG